MGKKARKTRWRALDIADDHSDSEESNTNSSAVSSRHSHSNGYYSKYSYSSQSTPLRRRYNQYDGSIKSTRSSSTTSENKITFNEDEYTRITTPRQDVLFKKGYLNKPKSYQTQTSTGNSTISTGNSTENGTPDHQSTDLDYESQFMFPNGFVDQNGIYYVNSYEPYPLMLFNPPTYYHEFSNTKTKRYSTGSLSESMSPSNEEATSQDLNQSGGEASNSGVSDYSGCPPVFNMVFPGYYMNGACTPTDLANSHHSPSEPVKKLRKRRERNSSKTIPGDSSEYTDENSGDEHSENAPLRRGSLPEHPAEEASSRVQTASVEKPNDVIAENQQTDVDNDKKFICDETLKTAGENPTPNHDKSPSNGCADKKTEHNEETLDSIQAQPIPHSPKPSILKPDAEEFVPRTYHPIPPHHLKMIAPNFMPIPLVPIGEFGNQNFAPHPAFIPPGIPFNFIPHHLGPKMFPPPPDFVSYPPPIFPEAKIEEKCYQNDEKAISEDKERDSTATPSHTPVVEDSKPQIHSKAIDIATVVSKLEAVKQERQESTITTDENIIKPIVNEPKPFRGASRFSRPQNFRRNYYNKYRNSPIRNGEVSPQNPGHSVYTSPSHFQNHPVRTDVVIQHAQATAEAHTRITYRNSPVRQGDMSHPIRTIEPVEKSMLNGVEPTPIVNDTHVLSTDYSQQIRNSPERFQRKNWKTNGYQNGYQGSPKRVLSYPKPAANGNERLYINAQANSNKNYSGSLRNSQPTEHKIDPVRTIISPATTSHDLKPEEPKTKSNSQWISVSSRKKKKNKNVEEVDTNANDDTLNDSTETSSDLFESYDVSQLVDVVPPSQVENQKLEEEEKKIEEILTNIAQNEVTEVMIPANIIIPEVRDIENDIILRIEEKADPSFGTVQEKVIVDDLTEDTVVQSIVVKEEIRASEATLNESSENVEEEGFKPKKKSRRGTQKPLTKKVIITDIFSDLSVETKVPLKKVVKKIEEIKPVITEPPVPIAAVDSLKESTPDVESDQPEKKSKKKKKNKTAKYVSNDNNTVPDDSFDVLLENSLSSKILEQTNDDISLELEKLIQKGMYNSLQEKMKSINVEHEADDFFKTIGSVLPPNGKDRSAATALKTPDFNRIFQSTRQFLKPNMVSVEHAIKVGIDDIDDKDTKSCSSTTDAADPSTGLVVDSASKVQNHPEAPVEEEIPDKNLYPITLAVKEWMCKTREATPEVEILKSPSAIQKEFGSGNGLKNHLYLDLDEAEDEEEITLFSSQETLHQEQLPDLLEYWENDLPVISTKDCDLTKNILCSDASKVCADGVSCDTCRTDKQDKDEVEVYESKYGQNEAFLHLHRELQEQRDSPRPGHSPYRAVCCSLQ